MLNFCGQEGEVKGKERKEGDMIERKTAK